MSDIEQIVNGEVGLTVKDKINDAITEANKLRDLSGRRLVGNINSGTADATNDVTVDTVINGTSGADHDSVPTTKAVKTLVDALDLSGDDIDLTGYIKKTELKDDDDFINPRNDTVASSQSIKAYVDDNRLRLDGVTLQTDGNGKARIKNAGVGNAQLATSAVTNSKIGDRAVTYSKMKNISDNTVAGRCGLGSSGMHASVGVETTLTSNSKKIASSKAIKNYVDSKVTTLDVASVHHSGAATVALRGCSIARTSVGKYTITIPNSGRAPIAVASLAYDITLSGASKESFSGSNIISARTISNTTVLIEIVELRAWANFSDGDDDYEVAVFNKGNVDVAFQVIISN